jgi:hypothetical protein
MRCFAFWVALFLALPLCAQVQDEPPAPVRTYNLLRENDDWSFLADPSLRSDFWDPIKYIPLGCEACYVSFGGEIREAFEQVGNDNWGKQRYMNAFLLQRYMLQSDWHLGENFRIFVQLKSGLEDFRAGGARPIDEKRLDFEAAFLEIGNTHKKNWAVLRVGRQELNYGSGRLVSVREGPNVRQSFDGVKIRSKAGAWNVDAWAVRPDLDRHGFFDNAPDHTTFIGSCGRVQILKTRGECHEGDADFVCSRLDGRCCLCTVARPESGPAAGCARRATRNGLGRAIDRWLSGETNSLDCREYS